ncbi:UDP-N-acetylmuramoyl-L-alanyl-D-glutamate--2,6-diaminopimelate ligase [Paraoerskovia sediminicola]|uniref:UDP-N-acetylmuramyl-tripeptide synthetase n=1 Tax=Paraoerskovia sediminicola TaxID=1138587 RepID=A0ABM8G6S4_9CELL|nr:UDP-N-acetylmuramoyl-L-alanyl-D-glutamate--2,6-diaminopimelate ligase [Paraoerskovia sediminicola]BDZ43844.1 UDP-N-acetylmuramoyl-L-alanyl-D-glutamate--2,6-diaminopimelate ligase [Paraoerskovia sediminicola]
MSSPIERIRPARNEGRAVRDLAAQFDLTIGGGATAASGVTVRSVASDNRVVAPGDLFVALPGARVHGARFVADAVGSGAAAVLTDREGAALVADEPDVADVPVLVAQDPRAILGEIASAVYGAPAQHLTTFAVTGTNGKTTTTYMVDHALRAMGFRGGLVGTVEMRSGDTVLPSRLTTPEAADLQALLAAMREDDVRTLAMEVSSHALALHRVDGVVFDVAGFTNLSQDHLDFHGDLPSYFAAKALLFTPEHCRRGVVVVDDVWGERMADSAQVPVATLRTRPVAEDEPYPADWWVEDVVPGALGTTFVLRHRDGRQLHTSTSLPGAFNVTNAALALVMVLEAGTDVRDLAEALEAAGGCSPAVPGRMQLVSTEPRVVVDFAHNPQALELALSALRPTTSGRLVVVFGATGERDTGKRPLMGAVAVEGADVVVVTDDDPHGEPAAQIRAEVLAGARAAVESGGDILPEGVERVVEVAPRAEAIRQAVLAAGPADTVLVAGRGHEVWQEIDGVDHALDDRVEVRRALAERPDQDRGVDRPETMTRAEPKENQG